jgi:uncharacterized protein (DUF2336 family)
MLLDELQAALSSAGRERRLDILTRVTELFIFGSANYSRDQVDIFDDVIAHLINTIDDGARGKLSRLLAPIDNAPSKVIRSLAFDDHIDVAQPVLSRSSRLDDGDLVVSANSKSQLHLQAIAQRRALSEEVTDVLVDRGDRTVVLSVVKNLGARFSDNGFRNLVDRANGDDVLGIQLGLRHDIPRPHYLNLIEQASRVVRARLTAENPAASVAIDKVVSEVADGVRQQVRDMSPDFAAAQAAVQRLHRSRRINESDIYQYARDRKFEETAIALSMMCDTPIDVAERALLDPAAEIILILARVAGLSSTTTKALMLLRASDRGLSTEDLDKALASFHRLQINTARRVLGFFRSRTKNESEGLAAGAAVADRRLRSA